jgi:hypothetical protein
MPERDIRKELKKRVEEYGGEIRAVAWLGRRNAPDVLVLIPGKYHAFIECKAPGGKPTKAQTREHDFLRSCGAFVDVVSTIADIDRLWPPRA